MNDQRDSRKEVKDDPGGKVGAALDQLASVAEAAADTLRPLPLASEVVAWLEEDLNEYINRLGSLIEEAEGNDESIGALSSMTSEDEIVSDLEELLEIADDVSNLVEPLLDNRASDDLAEELCDFVQRQVDPVSRSAQDLYHALIGAA